MHCPWSLGQSPAEMRCLCNMTEKLDIKVQGILCRSSVSLPTIQRLAVTFPCNSDNTCRMRVCITTSAALIILAFTVVNSAILSESEEQWPGWGVHKGPSANEEAALNKEENSGMEDSMRLNDENDSEFESRRV
ncbi:hypothetical protein ACHWQZ_G010383 [Mnemiopsis leidyi]